MTNTTAAASVAAATASVIAAIFGIYTFSVTSDQTEQGQITDRYTHAVGELGDPAPDVRVGGIYALRTLARDSPDNAPAITDVLAAYVRNHVLDSRDPACVGLATVGGPNPPPLILPSDVRAAVQVLGGLNTEAQTQSDQNLANVCLPRSDILAVATLSRVDLAGANLRNAGLDHARIDSAVLPGVDLRHAHVPNVEFSGSNLTGADLSNAYLAGSNFTKADLTGANFSNADLTGASLAGANVTGSNFAGAIGANLLGVVGKPAAY